MADVKPVIECSPDDDKWAVRAKMWDYIESKDLANFPRPVHNRIPNVKDANIAADQAKGLEAFQKAQTVKINPDKAQEQARFNVLEANKTLLVPTPRLREGLFNKIDPPAGATKEQLRICSMSQGVKEFSKPVGLDSKIKVDLIVIGSVAVSTKGWRIGKGEGYADLEYGMMRCMEAIDENTPVITTVHDCQVMDLPDEMFGAHDVTVDWIVTPTRVIQCQKTNKPAGILWHLLDKQRLKRVPVLKVLRAQEREAGKDVRIKNDLERSENTTTEGSEDEHGDDGRPRRQRYSRMPRRRYNYNPALYVSDFPKSLRVADFKAKVKESCEPLQVVWRGRNNHAFLVFETKEKCEEAKDLLQGLMFEDKEAKVEFSERGTQRRQSEGQEHTEESGNESRERGEGRRRRNRRRPTGQQGGGGRRRVDASEGDEYDTAEDGEDRRDGRNRRPMRRRVEPDHCVFIGSLPRTLRTSDFKSQVRGNDVNPIRVIWRPRNRYALLQFQSPEEAVAARKSLEDLAIDGKPLSVQECTGERRNRDEGGEGEDRPSRPPRSQRPPQQRNNQQDGGGGGPRNQRPARNQRRPPPRMDRRNQGESSDQDEGQGDAKQPMRRRRVRGPFSTVYVGNLPKRLRISDFKSKVRGSDVQPLRVLWRGNQGHAFLQFIESDQADECIKLLQGLTIDEKQLTVEKSVRRRPDGPDGPEGPEGPERPYMNHVDGSAGDDSGAE